MKKADISASPHNLHYLEQLYAEYRRDSTAFPEWRDYFDSAASNGSIRLGPAFKPRSVFDPCRGTIAGNGAPPVLASPISERLSELVRNHRVRGHIIAAVDPLGVPRPVPPELKLEFYGFSNSELDMIVNLPTLHAAAPQSIREIFQRLRHTYCNSIGLQYMHIDDLAVRQWLQHRIESSQNRVSLTRTEQLRILTRLTSAVVFD